MPRLAMLLALACLAAACADPDQGDGDAADATAATSEGDPSSGDEDGGFTGSGGRGTATDADADADADDGTSGASDDTDADTDTDADADDGADPPPPPSLTWLTYEYTCPRGVEGGQAAAEGVPTQFGATSYVYSFDGETWSINGGGGSASGITGDGTLEVACGSGNNHSAGTTVRAAVGVAPGGGRAGAPLRWETFDVVCPEVDEAWIAAEDIEPGFVAATYASQAPGADHWSINPSGGWSSHVSSTDHTLRILCGDRNSHQPGTRVRVALGYDDAPPTESLEWQLHEYTCPAGEGLFEAATGIDPNFAAVTYLASYDGESWDLQTLSGLSSRLSADGRLMVACGGGNDHSEGTQVRVAFGYP